MFNKLSNIDLINGVRLEPFPFSVGQKLTTTEWLFAIQAKVNEAINYVNSIDLKAIEYVDGVADNIRKETEESINVIKNNLDFLSNTVNDNLAKCKNYTDLEVTKVANKLVTTVEIISSHLNTLTRKDLELEKDISDLRNLLTNDMLFCPCCGVLQNVQTCFTHIYDLFRASETWESFENSINGETWESFEIKVNKYNWKNFDLNMNNLLP